MTVFRRLLLVEWSGLAVAIVLGAAALSVIAPNFLTEFNLYVMLRSLSVGLLVAFAQMVTLGVGQMNIAVGALGGLTAIIFGATMELYGFPLLVAIPVALGIGALGGLINGLLTARTGVNAFIITLATASAFTGINFGITGSIPFYKMPASLVAFGDRHLGAMPYLLGAPLIVALLLGLFFSRAPPGRRAGEAFGRRKVEDQGQAGPNIAQGDAFERAQEPRIELSARALISPCRVREPVADDKSSRRQGGFDRLVDMVDPSRREEDCFGGWAKARHAAR